jgi:hypothetical protein
MKQLHFFETNSSLKGIKDQFDLLLKNKQAINLIRLSFMMLGLSWILVGIFYKFLPPQIPLFFSQPWGESQLVDKRFLIFLPSVLTILFAVNHRLASMSIVRDELLSFIFLLAQLLMSFLSLTTIVRIIILLA